jgi:hypothetical protein
VDSPIEDEVLAEITEKAEMRDARLVVLAD